MELKRGQDLGEVTEWREREFYESDVRTGEWRLL
jgi:hypothetical protein